MIAGVPLPSISVLGAFFCLVFGLACASAEPSSERSLPEPTAASATAPPNNQGRILTIGDIGADNPGEKIERLRPLANYLRERLSDEGIDEVGILIAQNTEDMGRYLKNGRVDIYFDSPFPTLKVQELSGSRVILRRWKGGDATYWSFIFANRSSGIASLEDLQGRIIAVEDPSSTSGFLMPVATLSQQGFQLQEVSWDTQDVDPHEIGYIFTKNESNSVAMLMQGRVAAAALSNQDYYALPDEVKQELVTLVSTAPVPRQLVSVQPNIDPHLMYKIIEILTAMDEDEFGAKILSDFKKTKRFDALPPESDRALEELKLLMKMISTD